ncbi:MAG: BatA domain-containing protein [Deltaproteobacteria bacterium]|nr:BatA domain-containing protein [Deltaproteobacteria bacterium]
MSLGAPIGLLALLAVPILVGLYFLRRRQPPRVVSALFLWVSPDQRAEAGPKLQRFSREVSLALEIAATLAATGFLADLRLGASAAERQTVLVLDGSMSMSARLPLGRTVAEEALENAKRLALEDGGRVTLIASGLRPRLLCGPAAPSSELDALKLWPSGPAHDLQPALRLAHEIAGPRNRVRLITDGAPEPLPEGVEVLAIGQDLDNDAFTAALRADRGGVAHLALRIAHFGRSRADIPVVLRSEAGQVLRQERLSFEPGEEKALRIELAHAGTILVELPDDALPADGALRLLPQPLGPLKIGVALPDGPAAQSILRFLAVDGLASVGEPADLVFAAPGPGPVAPWTVVLGVAGEGRSLVGPFFADRRHPLLDAVPLEGLLWFAGEPVPGAPLVTSGDAILVSEAPGPVFHVNAELARSNLQRTAAWPVLLSNLLAMRRDALPGFVRHNPALDEELTVNIVPGALWTLEGPATEQALRGEGTLRLPAPAAPGRYRLKRDGRVADELEVLPIDRRESDLRDRSARRVPSPLPVGRIAADRPRSSVPLLLLVALLCLDWVVTSRAGGSRLGPRKGDGARI